MKRFMIVGLGNPGKDYQYTRHNIGFMVVDALAAAHSLNFDTKTKRGNAFSAEGDIAGARVILVKPQTYMNESGRAVRALADFYKLEPADILLIADDLDTPLGALRIRESGGAGGQKGVQSTIQHLGTPAFPRIRFGIGRPPGRMEPAAYVLQAFLPAEVPLVQETLDRCLKAIGLWLSDGIEMAMNRQNGTAEQAAQAQPKPKLPPSDSQEA
jgi:PTH1 family peptidyl-tRNA hydrolase